MSRQDANCLQTAQLQTSCCAGFIGGLDPNKGMTNSSSQAPATADEVRHRTQRSTVLAQEAAQVT